MTSLTHGILMSGVMINAYQRGLKSETRRVTKSLKVVNEDPDSWDLIFVPQKSEARFVSFAHKVERSRVHHIRLPYGVVGETLWFKETWKMWERDEDGRDFLHFRADDAHVDPTWWTEEDWSRPDPVWFKKHVFTTWQPSMFMPALCARYRNIEILGVRAERLLDISNVDAIHEGCPMDVVEAKTPRQWYFDLWDRLNGDRMPADTNPWVWVYQFSKCEDEET